MHSMSWLSIGSWLVAGVGVSFIFIGLFSKRIIVRQRPQCAKCGYPLDDIPQTQGKIICPECGRTPVGPTETYALRRRKLFITLGILLFVGSLILPTIPTMRANGPSAALPMSVQVRLWRTGDKKLKTRVQSAYRSNELSKAELNLLRDKLLDVLWDPSATTQELNDVVMYLVVSGKQTPLFDESVIEQIIRDESSPIRRKILQYESFRSSPPETPGLRAARREAALAFDLEGHRSAVEWLLKLPSDDLEDYNTIRLVITDADEKSFWHVKNNFDSASPGAVEIAVQLLEDQSDIVRIRALKCLAESLSERRTRNNFEFEEKVYTHILNILTTSEPSIRFSVRQLIEYLPQSAEAAIAKSLLETQDASTVESLIHTIARRDPDPIGLTPALAMLSRDENRSLRIRLQAVDAYHYIRGRARAEDEPEDIWSVYDALVIELVNGNHAAAFAYGEEIRSYQDPWTLGAITRLMLADGVTKDQMDQWFADRPGIIALLGLWNRKTDDPIERYRLSLHAIFAEYSQASSSVRAESLRALSMYFPDDSVNTLPQTPSKP